MCGIAGVIGQFSIEEANRIVRAMMLALNHRGPDDHGAQSWDFGDNVVALAHTRLSIIDPSPAGRQPMTEHCNRYWTVFNGEIYNFRDLRAILEPEGMIFKTSTDTETILQAYRRWQEASFVRLRGMFAFALLDTHTRRLHLVRDPLGIKPLYFYNVGNKLLFASEVQALLATGIVPRRLNLQVVAHYLRYGWVEHEHSGISGIQLLPAGGMLTLDLCADWMKSETVIYETPLSSAVEAIHEDRNHSTNHLFDILEKTVKSHLVSDVPIGLFLSGGIDSTVLLHLLHAAKCGMPKTFTVTFRERDYGEGPYARRVAEHYGADHQELFLSESDAVSYLPDALNAMDQPTMDGINTFVIAKAVHSAGLKVALSGVGSDELFGGYPSFRRARWAKHAAKVPLLCRKQLASRLIRIGNTTRTKKFWDLVASDCTPLSVYRISRRLFESTEISELIPDCTPIPDETNTSSCADEINEISRLELQGYMSGLLLRDTDFMSMANSIEVRVPFVDKMVVRYAMQLPGQWKYHRSIPKVLLLDSLHRSIPEYVWKRRKMGFTFPFDNWMRTTLRRQVEEVLLDKRSADAIGIRSKAIQSTWQRFLNRSVPWTHPWSLFVLFHWRARQQVWL